jgi:hypothetical protein
MNNKAFVVLTQTIFSSLGGAFIVYSYDDSPGGVLIGLIMILFSILLAFKT